MRYTAWVPALLLVVAPFVAGPTATALRSESPTAQSPVKSIARWAAGQPAFGMFVPSERAANATDASGRRLPPLYTEAGARALAAQPLLDYVFLNLEGAYDPGAVRVMVAGLKSADARSRPTLLVRIPTIEAAGDSLTRARVAEVLALGADGIVIPHVRSAEEARMAVRFFRDAGANLWSPANPAGTVVAMLMVEDKGAIAGIAEIAGVPGYSLLSCGIGSLTRDMGGDAPGAEAACASVRDLAANKGMPSMMTASASSLRARIESGYRGLLLSGTIEQATTLIADVRDTGR